jgi:hypothetical protein
MEIVLNNLISKVEHASKTDQAVDRGDVRVISSLIKLYPLYKGSFPRIKQALRDSVVARQRRAGKQHINHYIYINQLYNEGLLTPEHPPTIEWIREICGKHSSTASNVMIACGYEDKYGYVDSHTGTWCITL